MPPMLRTARLSAVARPSLVTAFAVGGIALTFNALPGGETVSMVFAGVGMVMAGVLAVAKA